MIEINTVLNSSLSLVRDNLTLGIQKYEYIEMERKLDITVQCHLKLRWADNWKPSLRQNFSEQISYKNTRRLLKINNKYNS